MGQNGSYQFTGMTTTVNTQHNCVHKNTTPTAMSKTTIPP